MRGVARSCKPCADAHRSEAAREPKTANLPECTRWPPGSGPCTSPARRRQPRGGRRVGGPRPLRQRSSTEPPDHQDTPSCSRPGLRKTRHGTRNGTLRAACTSPSRHLACFLGAMLAPHRKSRPIKSTTLSASQDTRCGGRHRAARRATVDPAFPRRPGTQEGVHGRPGGACDLELDPNPPTKASARVSQAGGRRPPRGDRADRGPVEETARPHIAREAHATPCPAATAPAAPLSATCEAWPSDPR